MDRAERIAPDTLHRTRLPIFTPNSAVENPYEKLAGHNNTGEPITQVFGGTHELGPEQRAWMNHRLFMTVIRNEERCSQNQ